MLEKDISSAIFTGQGTVNKAQTRVPFFSAKIAEELVSFLKNNRAQSRPVAVTTEMPLSPSLEREFPSAKVVQSRSKHSQIEPLHLLAAMLAPDTGRSG
jgi:hypothetical protein